jgi:hypothetical protein
LAKFRENEAKKKILKRIFCCRFLEILKTIVKNVHRGFELVSPDFRRSPPPVGRQIKTGIQKLSTAFACPVLLSLMLHLSWDASQWCYVHEKIEKKKNHCSTPVRSYLLHSFLEVHNVAEPCYQPRQTVQLR